MSVSLTAKQRYTEMKIRQGYSSLDVNLWQALCRQCEMEVGASVAYMARIIELAKHTNADVLDIVSTGRQLSAQKNINDKFMLALDNALSSEDESDEAKHAVKQVLDLTADEELSSDSASYEETSEPGSAGSRLNSNECYEIDGFVVPDDKDDDVDRDDVVTPAKSSRPLYFEEVGSVKVGKKKPLLKRRLSVINEEAEEE